MSSVDKNHNNVENVHQDPRIYVFSLSVLYIISDDVFVCVIGLYSIWSGSVWQQNIALPNVTIQNTIVAHVLTTSFCHLLG